MDEYYKYRVFELNILSQLYLPELKEAEFSKEDFIITFGKNPKEIRNPLHSGILYQAKKDHLLLRIDTVGSYYVKNGNRVTIERLNNSTDSEIRLFLLGSAMGAILHQKMKIPLHGTTVVKNNQAHIILGDSGAGKSSLAAALVKRNFKLLSEDISIIVNQESKFKVIPGIQHLKLWQDILVYLGEDFQDLPLVRPQILKYRKEIYPNIASRPTCLKSIIFLSHFNKNDFNVEEQKGISKVEKLWSHIYRPQYMKGLDMTENHFQQIIEIASRIKIIDIQRPMAPLMLNELSTVFESII